MMQDMAKREKNSREKAIELLQNHDRVFNYYIIIDGRKNEIWIWIKNKRAWDLYNATKIIIEINSK